MRYTRLNPQTSVIVTRAEYDGREWIHLSVAHPDRVPTWEELREIKEWLIGRERYAYQVLPPAARYVNIHPNCLHIFAVVDRPEPLPDFTMG